MTTIVPIEQSCAVCGGSSEHYALGSTSTFGAPDLDLRPPPLERDTLQHQIQCCPHCGYCADDIAEAPEVASELVATAEYQTDLKRESFPELTRHFLCASRVLRAAGQIAESGWMALKGAWAADDEDAVAALP